MIFQIMYSSETVRHEIKYIQLLFHSSDYAVYSGNGMQYVWKVYKKIIVL
jgi:hypothetical protein